MGLKDVGASGLDIEDGRYLLNIAAPLEDAEPGKFGDRIKWQFHVWSTDGQTCYTSDDETWWQYTSTKMGEKANARKFAEAFLGRALERGESGADIGAALFNEETGEGGWAYGMILRNAEGYLDLMPDSVKPYTAAGAAAVEEPEQEAEAEPEPAPAPKPAAKAPAAKAATAPKPAAKAAPAGPAKPFV